MIIQENNFCRVFEIPEDFPEEYCFEGPKPVTFHIVDWFYPIPMDDIHSDNVKPWSEYETMLREFLSNKVYLKDDCSYLLLTDFNESFVFKKGD